MAGNSQKKRAKGNALFKQIFSMTYLIVNVLYMYSEIFNNDSTVHWLRVIFISGSSCACFFLTYSSLEQYIWTDAIKGYTFDYGCMVLFVELTSSLFSSYFFYLLLVVPAFIMYKLTRMLLSYIFTPTQEEKAMNKELADSRHKKRQRKSRR